MGEQLTPDELRVVMSSGPKLGHAPFILTSDVETGLQLILSHECCVPFVGLPVFVSGACLFLMLLTSTTRYFFFNLATLAQKTLIYVAAS